jgi:hypothetical protein
VANLLSATYALPAAFSIGAPFDAVGFLQMHSISPGFQGVVPPKRHILTSGLCGLTF